MSADKYPSIFSPNGGYILFIYEPKTQRHTNYSLIFYPLPSLKIGGELSDVRYFDLTNSSFGFALYSFTIGYFELPLFQTILSLVPPASSKGHDFKLSYE